MKAPIYFDGKEIGIVTDVDYNFDVPAEGVIPGDKVISGEVSASFEMNIEPDAIAKLHEMSRKVTMAWELSNLTFGSDGNLREEKYREMAFALNGRAFIWCHRCGLGRLYSSFSRMSRRISLWKRHRCARGHRGAIQ